MSFPFLQPYAGLSNSLQTAQAAGGPGGAVGGWVEVGRTTLGIAGDTIDVSSLPDKRYYMILCHGISSGSIASAFRLNNDSGSNYASRYSTNGGADATQTSGTYMIAYPANEDSSFLQTGYISNLSTNEKLAIWFNNGSNDSSAASVAPVRRESVAKWTNTTNTIDQITSVNVGGGDYASGSELVVLGWDPADTHTSNFWEELASVELGGTNDTLSSGTITAKKYLWVQAWLNASGDCNHTVQFNNDTSTNYAQRGSYDGGTDSTSTSTTGAIGNYGSAMNTSAFMNMFIINNASNEKLVICHIVDQEASGAATAPHRQEQVGKWDNTSNQITEIDIVNSDSGDYAAGSIIKVWGAD